MEIYCDESGFTGNNLNDHEQTFFTYSAVQISNEEATSILNHLRTKLKLPNGEIKAKNVLKTERGFRALLDVFKEVAPFTKMVMHHKKYALACKVFEYFFEPIIADKNTFFYGIGLHRFVAAIVYDAFENGEENVEALFRDLVLIAKGDSSDISLRLLSGSHYPKHLKKIFEFISLNRPALLEELVKSRKYDPWLLDLSVTSLSWLLSEWGKADIPMEVTCDSSKPLLNSFFVDYPAGQEKHIDFELFGKTVRYTFPLKRPILFADSKKVSGLQVADLVSSGLNFALRLPGDPNGREIANILFHCVLRGYSVIAPEPNELQNGKFNEKVLNRMVKISKAGGDVLKDLF